MLARLKGQLSRAWGDVGRAGASRRALWLAVFIALAPLAVLLALQYRWLVELERTSSIASRTSLQQRLEIISKEVKYFYASRAEKMLNVPPYLLSPQRREALAAYLRTRPLQGFQGMFVVSFGPGGETLAFDPESGSLEEMEFSRKALAVWAATAPWKLVAKAGDPLEQTDLIVDERDRSNRMILNPVVEERGRLVGLTGLILDQGFFERELLPKVIQKTVESAGADTGSRLWVADGTGRLVVPRSKPSGESKKVAWLRFGFVFTDWSVGMWAGESTPEQLARANFLVNVGLSAALAALLLGGILLAMRTAAREVRLSTMKSDFVSNVSHELRTPLASIRVFGELLRHGRVRDGDKVREYGAFIESESRRLTRLINNILDFSRIESGRRVYRFAEADLEEIVDAALASFEVRLADAGFQVEVTRPPEPLPRLLLDAGAMEQAVGNLLDNAVKYSNDDRRIEVVVGREDGCALVAVADHGVGIPADDLERIFERFHRVSTGLVHDVKGVGLGLSLVRHIVDAHGGRVTVESVVGRGSTFSVRIPMSAACEEA